MSSIVDELVNIGYINENTGTELLRVLLYRHKYVDSKITKWSTSVTRNHSLISMTVSTLFVKIRLCICLSIIYITISISISVCPFVRTYICLSTWNQLCHIKNVTKRLSHIIQWWKKCPCDNPLCPLGTSPGHPKTWSKQKMLLTKVDAYASVILDTWRQLPSNQVGLASKYWPWTKRPWWPMPH